MTGESPWRPHPSETVYGIRPHRPRSPEEADIERRIAERPLTPEQIAHLRREFGLDPGDDTITDREVTP